MKNNTTFDWKVHVEHIDEFGKNLTDWEINFISDMMDKIAREAMSNPSDKQIETIKRIYDDKC